MDGVLYINKAAGMTSHDVVYRVRRITGQKKVGHAGTLDPMAEGLLTILIGKATRLSDELMARNKKYAASFRLGITTDTQDITGTVLTRREINNICLSDINNALIKFTGSITQIPPMYSAVKIDGKKLYELAREGKTIERKARSVEIYSISSDSAATGKDSDYILNVHCSKGTYIRTLIHDIGEELGCGAVMTALTRTASGDITLEKAITLEQAAEFMSEGKLEERLLWL